MWNWLMSVRGGFLPVRLGDAKNDYYEKEER